MDQQDGLFNIQVNEDGKRSILLIYKLTKIVFWMGVVMESLWLFDALRTYYLYKDLPETYDPLFFWDIRIFPVYLIITGSLSVLSSFYFFRFSNKASESVKLNDSQKFNESLPWVYRSLRISVVVIIFSVAYFMYRIISGIL